MKKNGRKTNELVQFSTRNNLRELSNKGESEAWRVNINRIFIGQRIEILSMKDDNELKKGSSLNAIITNFTPIKVNGKRRYVIEFDHSQIQKSKNPFIKFLRQPVRYFN